MEAARKVLRMLALLTLSVLPGQALTLKEELHHQMLNVTSFPAYDAAVRPVHDASGSPVTVEIDAVMISVGPVSDMDMTWTLSCYIRQEWNDPRLMLPNTTTGGGAPGGRGLVQMGYQEVDRLWLPDIFFSNSQEDRKHLVTVPNHLVYIDPDTGNVIYSQRLTITLNCEMNLEKFPHDRQRCEFVIESYSYKTDDMILKWSSARSATDFMPTAFIPDFAITDTQTLDCTTTYAIGTFPCLKARVTLERKTGYYITQNYAPTILIVILSWASFWIDHEAVPARISVGLLTVLTITTQLSGSRAQLPRVPYIKAIDVWMSTCLVFVFAAYMEYAVVTVLSRRYRKKLAGRRVRSIFKVVADRSRTSSLGSLSKLTEAARDSKRAEEDNTPTCSLHSQDIDVESGLAKSSPKAQLYAEKEKGPEKKGAKARKQATVKEPETPTAASSKKALPGFEKKGMDTGRMVDQLCRLLFPVAFAIFSVAYWVYYSVVN
ncbi:glycine receptor subunit alpha-4-like [Babylonia areolata]|uniref:glycine receptor subunit alpha-4-like n=1 Tax=Babylonia areolata TaxID=304850 RepID=UPI003FCFCF34